MNENFPTEIRRSAADTVGQFEKQLSEVIDELRLQISKLKQVEKIVADLKDLVGFPISLI